MTELMKVLVFAVVWVCGCFVFDAWLGLKGGWLMWGGAVTLIVSVRVSGIWRDE